MLSCYVSLRFNFRYDFRIQWLSLVSCDVNQSWVRVCKLYDDILYILLSKILYDVTRHLAPPPLWVSWDIVRLLTIEKTKKHDTMCVVYHYMNTWPTKISDDTLAFLFNKCNLCCVFLCLCCQFLWIVHVWLPLRYSLMFIYYVLLYSFLLTYLVIFLLGFSGRVGL
jgi:hypothetical protein